MKPDLFIKGLNASCATVVLILFALAFGERGVAQIMYQIPTNQRVNVGSYGRVGVDWNFENGGSVGRRLNLNNMGSIGGRLEEQDYLEVVPNFNWVPKEGDSTRIYAQLRLAVYSTSLTAFGNSTSTSLGGLAFALPEMYVEARNIKEAASAFGQGPGSTGGRMFISPTISISTIIQARALG